MKTPTSDGRQQGSDVVRQVARAFERDRYLAALLAPSSSRSDLIALAALAGELQRIPAYVHEPMAGEIRLQWWRDTLEAGIASAGVSSGHPIADAVSDLARRHRVPVQELHALIDAVSDRLDDTPFETAEALTANLKAWDGRLFRLALRIVRGANANETEAALLDDLGAVYGLARIVMEIPAELAQGRMLLPREALHRREIALETAHDGSGVHKWQALIEEFTSACTRRLDNAVQRYQEAPRDIRVAALPIALVRPYLGLTQRVDIRALEARDISPLKRVWQLWRVHRSGRP